MTDASESVERKWEEVPVDPDPVADLGYEHRPLTTIHVEEDGEQYILLPREEDHRSDAEFMVASPGSVRWLADWR